MNGLPLFEIALAALGGLLLLGVVFWIGWRESHRPFPVREDYPVETGDEDPPYQRADPASGLHRTGGDDLRGPTILRLLDHRRPRR